MLKPNQPTKSTYCGSQACVRVTLDGQVLVEDTKPGGGKTTFTPADWRLFAAAVGRGEFDE